jgi:SAM-dependent methyltransferase
VGQLCVADLNQDGYLDIVQSNYRSDHTRSLPVFIYWGGKEPFTPARRSALVGSGTRGVSLADLDHDGFLDVVFANSVFTHFPEDLQILWLKELRRLLRAGGFFIVSTHSPTLTFTRPDLTPDQHATLLNRGFLFAPGNGPFSEDSAFHSRQYMEESWGRHFDLRSFASLGLVAYQDLSVWEKPCSG